MYIYSFWPDLSMVCNHLYMCIYVYIILYIHTPKVFLKHASKISTVLLSLIVGEVKAEESIFTEPSQNKRKSDFVPTFLEDLLSSKTADEVARTREACEGDETCLFDILTTNNTAFGKATHKAKLLLGSTKEGLSNFPPNVTGDSTLFSVMNEELKVQYQTEDNDVNVRFTLVTNSTDISITENGALIWHPTSIEPTFAIVEANNSKAVGQLVLTLMVCYCENNGTCDFEQEYDSASGEGGSMFKVRLRREFCINLCQSYFRK
uniref:Mucin-4-like C8-3 domain-containing protein n=1 Tax=Eptatretus burgeri TaxID=7764 RepID=A0A8C4QH25_EPTBU